MFAQTMRLRAKAASRMDNDDDVFGSIGVASWARFCLANPVRASQMVLPTDVGCRVSWAAMRVSLLTPNASARERCPYCHDSLGEVERVACEGCGTPHHPVCLEELGGCTVLGCSGGVAKKPLGPTEEIRRRVQARAERFVADRSVQVEPEAAVRARRAGQPLFCTACERELISLFCPKCRTRLMDECAGDSVHCARESCRSFYGRLAVGEPIDRLGRRRRTVKLLRLALALAGALVCALTAVLLSILTGGPLMDSVVLLLVVLGAAAFVFAPLFVMMMKVADRR